MTLQFPPRGRFWRWKLSNVNGSSKLLYVKSPSLASTTSQPHEINLHDDVARSHDIPRKRGHESRASQMEQKANYDRSFSLTSVATRKTIADFLFSDAKPEN